MDPSVSISKFLGLFSALFVVQSGLVYLTGSAYSELEYPLPPGPKVHASKGAVWPAPARIATAQQFFTLQPAEFEFQTARLSCAIVEQAYSRYQAVMKREALLRNFGRPQNFGADPRYMGAIEGCSVALTDACEKAPHLNMDESYNLTVSAASCQLTAATTWGVLRGLETFVQLLYPALDGATLLVNETSIEDAPRFPHRGLLLDTARHYLPLPYILLELDAMAAAKMNVLHWHIVDDQSFPYQSRRYPNLSNKGAYNNVTAIYTPRDVSRVIEYARRRGIRVIPEFDTPGHTRSWAEGQPGLITECWAFGQPTGRYSNIDPSKETNRRFIADFFAEVGSLFYDKFIHIGGDEVPNECWSTNPDVLNYMREQNITGNFRALQSLYIQWLTRTLDTQGKEVIAWEEVFTHRGSNPPLSVIIHIWLTNPASLLPHVVKSGYRALLSQGWYLDHLDTDWQQMYSYELFPPNLTEQDKRKVLGGEACMWGEMVDPTNLHSRIWPRAAAVAERLWSPQSVKSLGLAARRLEEFVCRLRRRGIPASPPNGPGYCQI